MHRQSGGKYIKIDLKALQGSIDLEWIRTHQMPVGTSHYTFQGNILSVQKLEYWNIVACDRISV